MPLAPCVVCVSFCLFFLGNKGEVGEQGGRALPLRCNSPLAATPLARRAELSSRTPRAGLSLARSLARRAAVENFASPGLLNVCFLTTRVTARAATPVTTGVKTPEAVARMRGSPMRR